MIGVPEIVERLLVALLLCGGVGLQRGLAGKVAGRRTHILVGLGAAVFTLVSGYAFGAGSSNTDRIAAQVVSGIGFIGGGAILKDRRSVRGLTTAAGLWAVEALGMAAGAGLYALGVAAAAVILLTLVALRYAEAHFPRRARETWTIRVTLADDVPLDEAISHIRRTLASQSHRIALETLAQEAETRLTFAAVMPRQFDIAALTERVRAAGARCLLAGRGRQRRGGRTMT